MTNPRTQETEMLDVAITVMTRARKINVDEVRSAQDAMINMRIDWEELQSRLRSRKIDGFEPVVDAMIQLAATTIAMASALTAKIVNQRIWQMQQDEELANNSVDEFAASKSGKQKRKTVAAK